MTGGERAPCPGEAARRHHESTRPAAKATATIRIDGDEGVVVEQATRLLRLVVEEIEGAILLGLRVDYDPASPPAHVFDPTAADVLEIAGRGATSPGEAELWRLVLPAAVATR